MVSPTRRASLGPSPNRSKRKAPGSFIPSATRRERAELEKIIENGTVLTCDFAHQEEIDRLGREVGETAEGKLDGILHSIAFANYSEGLKPFHETKREDFLQATQISSFSLIELARVCKPHLASDASIVTLGISSTEVTAENYGYMAPIKASLEASVRYLAKSFFHDSEVRFNSVNAGPLKTAHPRESPVTL